MIIYLRKSWAHYTRHLLLLYQKIAPSSPPDAKSFLVAVGQISCLAFGTTVLLLSLVSFLSMALLPAVVLFGGPCIVAAFVGGTMLFPLRHTILSRGAFSMSGESEVGQMRSGSVRLIMVDVDQKYGIFKMAKFGIAQLTGFFIAEGVLALSLLLWYHDFWVPRESYSSPILIGLNLLAFVVGVGVAFYINERVTVRIQDGGGARKDGFSRALVRFLKYQAVNGAGKPIILVIELILLALLGLSPVLGLIIGAMICYPVMYLMSMRFIWHSHTAAS